MDSTLPKIIVGIGTLKRPKMLEKTLESLKNIKIPEGAMAEFVVADNDPAKSAEDAVLNQVNKFNNAKLTYLCEPKRGIVFMRNTIIDYAISESASLLAFIDDDEIVSPEWLIRMVETKSQYNADVVGGTVIRILPEDSPRWVAYGKFFERTKIKTGTIRKAASTSNVLFDLKLLVEDFGLKFHPALNLSGSSDTFLFSQATEMGAKIVWLGDNLVEEWIPKSRMNVRWLVQRGFRHNNCRTIRSRLKNPYFKVLFNEGGYGLAHLLMGIIFFPVNVFRGKAGLVHTLRFFAKGVGSFAGLIGIVFKEYEKVHGH